MTSANNFFWTFGQAVSYDQFALVNYIGFHDKAMLHAGGCDDTDGKPQIDKTDYLRQAYECFPESIIRWKCAQYL